MKRGTDGQWSAAFARRPQQEDAKAQGSHCGFHAVSVPFRVGMDLDLRLDMYQDARNFRKMGRSVKGDGSLSAT